MAWAHEFDVDCPTCGAKAGDETCNWNSRRKLYHGHKARREAQAEYERRRGQ